MKTTQEARARWRRNAEASSIGVSAHSTTELLEDIDALVAENKSLRAAALDQTARHQAVVRELTSERDYALEHGQELVRKAALERDGETRLRRNAEAEAEEWKAKAEAKDVHIDRWRENYLTVADAIAAESTSPENLAGIARATRNERDALAARLKGSERLVEATRNAEHAEHERLKAVALAAESRARNLSDQLGEAQRDSLAAQLREVHEKLAQQSREHKTAMTATEKYLRIAVDSRDAARRELAQAREEIEGLKRDLTMSRSLVRDDEALLATANKLIDELLPHKPSKCGNSLDGCGKSFDGQRVYRCLDCDLPMHRDCLQRHCGHEIQRLHAEVADLTRKLEAANAGAAALVDPELSDLRARDGAQVDAERLRAALLEISEALPCETPCSPTYIACTDCGRKKDRWCAGCIARKALIPSANPSPAPGDCRSCGHANHDGNDGCPALGGAHGGYCCPCDGTPVDGGEQS